MDLTVIGQHCAQCGATIGPDDTTCAYCHQPAVDPAVAALASNSGGMSLSEFVSSHGCTNVASATLMLHYLESGDAEESTLAARCLHQTSDPAVLRELVTLLGTQHWLGNPVSSGFPGKGPGPSSAISAVREVFQGGGANRIAVLRECLTGPNDKVREAAADLLQFYRGPEVCQSLSDALRSDSSPGVRARSAYALGQVCDVSSVDVLTAALNDSSAQVQSKAAQSLSRLGVRAIPSAVNSLETGSPEVALQGARLLGQMGSPEAIHALVNALRNRRDLVRLYAEQALAGVGVAVVIPLLEEVIRNGDSVGVREGVAYVLRTMRMPDREHEIVQPVVKAAERLDAGIEMPAAAYEALGKLEGLTTEQLRAKLTRI